MAGAATVPYGRRVLRLLRARAASIAAFLVLVFLFDAMRTWSLHLQPEHVAFVMPLWAMGSVAALVPIMVEATGLRRVSLVVVTTVATLAALGVAAWAIGALHPGPIGDGVRGGVVLSNEAFLFRGWWLYAAAGLLFAAYCRIREHERDALRAARRAELARADTQREIVASRLKVLQARVEPSLLFDALADVRAMYLLAPAAADALLDDLVAYLRAALPQMRGGASTLGREVALAEAYLRIVPTGRNKQLVTESEVADEVADTDFPPMVLLPLVHAAAEAGCVRVRIEAKPQTGRTAIAVHADGNAVPGGWSGDALDVVRETLLHYLGSDASLTVTHEQGQATATVTWPGLATLDRMSQRVA